VNFPDLIQTILIYGLPVVFAITLHEAAHGYVAHLRGDNTAWMMGRVTLNPMPHIDPMGTLVMPIVLFLATGGNFLFGYARPVPVNFGRLNHPKRDMIWVALAGPAVNFIQAFVWAFAMYGLIAAGVQSRCQSERRDVCLQFIPAAAAGWRSHLGGLAALEASRLVVARRALWLLYRDGLGGVESRRHPLDGAHHEFDF
jgi:Zn-dependent protease